MRQQKSQLVSGTIIANRYRILEPLDLGLNGEFYRSVTLEESPRKCSIERLDLGIAVSTSSTTRIRRVLRGIDRIDHRNLASIESMECLPDRSIVLIREELVGQSLASAIREDGVWSWRRALSVGLQVCQGLKVLHHCGHFHGCLRLEHILRAPPSGVEEQIKVVDLGFKRIIVELRERRLQVVRSPFSSLSTHRSSISSVQVRAEAQVRAKAQLSPEPVLQLKPGFLQSPHQLQRVSANPAMARSGEQLDIRCVGDLLYTLISGKTIRSAKSAPSIFTTSLATESSELMKVDAVISDSNKSTRSLPKLSELELPAAVERVIYRCWQSGIEAGFAEISTLMNEMRDALELDICRARAEATTRPESLPIPFEDKIRLPSR